MRGEMCPAKLMITWIGTPASAIRVIDVWRRSYIRSHFKPAASRTASHGFLIPHTVIGRNGS